MSIQIYPPSKKLLGKSDSLFALQQDDWNDYSYHTLYHLCYRQKSEEPNVVTYIGSVKTLKRGQTTGPRLIKKLFTQLGEGWVSVGTSLDCYQRLNELPSRRRKRIMNALQDAVAIPNLIDEFKGEDGWDSSIFRDTPDWEGFIRDARILYKGNFKALVGCKYYPQNPYAKRMEN